MRYMVMSLILLAASAAPGHGGVCTPEDTVEECWEKAQQSPIELRAEEEATKAVKASETGIDTAGASLATTTRDFLPLLDLAGVVAEGTEADSDEGSAVVDLNFILPGEIRERNGKLQLVLNTKSSLYDPIRSALEDGGGDDVEDAIADLEGQIGDIGEYAATFSVNWKSKALGRYFSAHRDLFAHLVDISLLPTAPAEDAFDAIFINLLGSLGDAPDCVPSEACDCASERCEILQLAGGSARLAAELVILLENAAVQEAKLAEVEDRALRESKVATFGRLVDNQPQLHISAVRRLRSDLVGPDEWSGKVTYEQPLAPNVNRLKKKHPTLATLATREKRPATKEDLPGLDLYRQYVTENEARLESADRLSFSLEYQNREQLAFTLPELGTPVDFDSSRSLLVSLGWGRALELNDDGTTKTRVDVAASWDDVSDDPARQDRGLVSFTLTRDFGTFSIPLGLVYANKPEFLATQDVDELLSAHVGLKYSVDTED